MQVAKFIKCSFSHSRLTSADFQSESRSSLFDCLLRFLKGRPIHQIIQEQNLDKRIIQLSPLQRGYIEGFKAYLGVVRQIELIQKDEESAQLDQSPDYFSVDCHTCTEGALVCFGCGWPKKYPIYIAINNGDILRQLETSDSGQPFLPGIALEIAHIKCREKSCLKLLVDLVTRIGALVIGIFCGMEFITIWGPFSGALVGAGIGGFGGDWLSNRLIGHLDQKRKRQARDTVSRIKIYAQVAEKVPLKPASNNELDIYGHPICPITLSPIPLQERAYYLHFNQGGYPLITAYNRDEIAKWLSIKSTDPQTNKTIYNLLDFRGRVIYVAPLGARMNAVDSIQPKFEQNTVHPIGFEFTPFKERVFHFHLDKSSQPLVTMYKRQTLLNSTFESRKALFTKQNMPVFLDFLGRVMHKSSFFGLAE